MASELKLFSDVLSQLWRSHDKPWDYRSDVAKQIYLQIRDRYPSFQRFEELEHFLPSTDRLVTDFASTRRFLYLNPCDGQPTFVPVLSLKCDFKRVDPEVRLRVGLFLRDGDEIKAIGLRFESPEGDGAGIHDYYHMQYITSFYDGTPVAGVPSWLPATQPAMALEADGPVGLLLSLIMSLYGLKQISSLARALTGDLTDYLNEFAPDYWLVQSTAGHFKYKTWKSADRFEDRVKKRHKGCTVKRIDAATYQKEDGRDRHID